MKMGLTQTVTDYLKVCHIRVSEDYLAVRLESHPDYPTVLSLVDTLEEFKLAYSIFSVKEKSSYGELDYPLLAHINKNGRQFFQLAKSPEAFVKDKKGQFKYWDGMVLTVDSNQKIKKNQHSEQLEGGETDKSRMLTIGVSLYIALAAIGILTTWKFWPYLMHAICSLAGIALAYHIILKSLGYETSVGRAFCPTESDNQQCSEVLHSPAVKLIKFGSPAELAMAYFIINLLTTFFCAASASSRDFGYYFLVISILGSLVGFASLIYQATVIKKWCMMCVCIVGILWTQLALNLFATATYSSSMSTNNSIVFGTGLALAAVMSLPVFWLQYILKISLDLRKIQIKELRWARNGRTFLSALKNNYKRDDTPWENEFSFGNVHAPIKILAVCGTFCRPCAKSHRILERLLSLYEDKLSIILRFSINLEDLSDRRTLQFLRLAYLQETLPPDQRWHAFESWFELMDEARWLKMWDIPKTLPSTVVEMAHRHQRWCETNKIRKTPTILINGHEMPDYYQADNLEQLIPMLHDLLQNETQQVVESQG